MKTSWNAGGSTDREDMEEQWDGQVFDRVTGSQIIRAYGIQPIVEAPSNEEITIRQIDSYLSNQLISRGENRQLSIGLTGAFSNLSSLHLSKNPGPSQLPLSAIEINSNYPNTQIKQPSGVGLGTAASGASYVYDKDTSVFNIQQQDSPPKLFEDNSLSSQKLFEDEGSVKKKEGSCFKCGTLASSAKIEYQKTWKTHLAAAVLGLIGFPCGLCFLPYFCKQKFQDPFLVCSVCSHSLPI